MVLRVGARWAAAVAVAWSFLGASPATAATIQRVSPNCFQFAECGDTSDHGILISGEIVKGDYYKFRAVLAEGRSVPRLLYLRSPGGDVSEALQIGRLARELYLEAVAPAQIEEGKGVCFENDAATMRRSGRRRPGPCVCASACFFIYAGAVRRNEAAVGIHRFYIDPSTNAKLTLQESISRMRAVRQPVIDYLREMGVPGKYVDIMFATSSRELYVPTTAEIRADFLGYPPEIMEWLMAQCKTGSDREAAEVLEKKGLLSALNNTWERTGCLADAMAGDRVARYRQFRQSYDQFEGFEPVSPKAE
ncbi:hypothetical protein [Microvirga sp. Mcv34]|uniref:COG3904 family protein n=1 Tax=Microvirga sp. Mcv34 TaxID=2926016 RepID=UPI0021C732FF|nr:hypothetical protein [Microvirga sp. Mcv34]